MEKIFAVVPARAGSKGVPGKNIKLLGGHPLIAYAIAAAQLSSKISRIIVSTDSPNIAELAKCFGAEVPFLRPVHLSQDHSLDVEYIRHTIEWFLNHEGSFPDILVQLRPTTPFRNPDLIDRALEMILSDKESTSLRSVHELPEPPQKMMGISEGILTGLFPYDPRPEYYNFPRQAFPLSYHPNGYVDIVKSKIVMEAQTLYGSRILAFVTPVTAEVDCPEDFDYLEYLLEKKGSLLRDFLQKKDSKVRGQLN